MTAPTESEAKALATLEKRILSTIDTLFKISVTTFDFQEESGPVLTKRINRLTGHLKDVETASQAVNTHVPLKAIDFIDQGGNPDLFTKEMGQLLVDKNQKSNGMVVSMKNFNDRLREEVRRNYPELDAEYSEAQAQQTHT
ncbi:Mediator of RNA polymerase II transcription subunit 10 [Entophlyctis luteolus]|nr:Mediator of RNA polymerase II transcription subunit 10 [Entophlyctis luteolus]KAJ3380785.1 Mediator of RNA polymerase II transcription subunit 10 [Entophlyctis sp. JEL0112]